ncbi:hypothetical protein HMPREF1633_16330 [Tissierellia bacterium S5-A11]|nr:hypothetical protein HMPREF1633_16330 [Tissierellia bacterium S5-A11]
MLDGLGRKRYLIFFILMLVIMIVFLTYVFKHPETSLRMPVVILQIFYIFYIIAMLTCLVKFFITKDDQS